jgi:hypothetical protein
MMEQDVTGFENFLQSHKDKIDPELMAAKIYGRWRNGVPPELSPDTDLPPGGIQIGQIDDFDYVNKDGSGGLAVCAVQLERIFAASIREGSRLRDQGCRRRCLCLKC